MHGHRHNHVGMSVGQARNELVGKKLLGMMVMVNHYGNLKNRDWRYVRTIILNETAVI